MKSRHERFLPCSHFTLSLGMKRYIMIQMNTTQLTVLFCNLFYCDVKRLRFIDQNSKVLTVNWKLSRSSFLWYCCFFANILRNYTPLPPPPPPNLLHYLWKRACCIHHFFFFLFGDLIRNLIEDTRGKFSRFRQVKYHCLIQVLGAVITSLDVQMANVWRKISFVTAILPV